MPLLAGNSDILGQGKNIKGEVKESWESRKIFSRDPISFETLEDSERAWCK